MITTTPESALRKATEAHTNLTIFSTIVAILESGCLYGNSPHRAAGKIIKLCKDEQQRQLRIYDKAVSDVLK